ncbi:MAG TPA: hypothetical protein VMZ31_00330 [Phycisphaerae bacterium]|nr:hypothetical protein [Phycisphaerae bacterium]
MRRLLKGWWKLLLILSLGGYTVGSSGCLADVLRSAAGELDPEEEQSDVDKFLDSLKNLFD